MSYEGTYPSTLKKLLNPYWRLLFHVFVSCFSGRKGGLDGIPQKDSSAIVTLTMDWDYNFSKYIFEEMKSNLTGQKKDVYAMYPRFLQMIFDAKYPEIEKPEPHDTYDMKTLGSSTFSLLTQSRRGTNVSFQGTKPLEKFGRFPEIDNVQDAPTMNEPAPASTASPPKPHPEAI